MRRDSQAVFDTAIQAIRADEPDAAQISASANRVAARLGIDSASALSIATIESCADVRQLLASYRAGSLSDSRSVLIRAHLRDCGECHRCYVSGQSGAALDWSTPKPQSNISWHLPALRWALAPTLAVLALTFFIYRMFWQIPPGVRAEVRSIDGSAYRISDAGDLPLLPGDKLNEGDHLRTSGGAHAVLQLSDGSAVEVDERSVLAVGARGRNMTVAVDTGAVIVQAARRTSGHLYVKTPDCRVAVTGTVFSVNAGIKGSRVAVLQGTVDVTHAGIETLVHAGDQVSTNDNLSPEPVDQQIAWSHDLDRYLPLLAQFNTLQQRIDRIASPQLRYTSDLLGRVPANTLLYVSIPNLGGFLSEANTIFHEQLNESPALQQWWDAGSHHNNAELDALIEQLHQVSEYLGDEVVVVGVQQPKHPGFAVVTDLKKNGLDDLLRQQVSSTGSASAFVVFDEASLAAAPTSSQSPGQYALVRQHEAVFSNSLDQLKQMNGQLNAGASGFATGAFGQQISAAYSRGAGVILAADLHQMLHENSDLSDNDPRRQDELKRTGFDGVRYLIAEHRERNGLPENHVNLQFAGTRQGAASWLAAPAPIGSLQFVTPNASIAVAFLSKDPAAIADDIMKMANPDKVADNDRSEAETNLQISVRNDLAANLGGDFLLSLDGAVLPTPAWKAVVEVRNAGQLEKTLERMVTVIHNRKIGNGTHNIVIQSSQIDDQAFYAIRDLASGTTVAQYTFADGYMIMAPDRALLMQALRSRASGDSLAHSSAFKALLPRDENANYSAIVYQNIGPVLTPLLSYVSGESAQALSQLAADGRPTAICAWGKDDRIEAASDSHLFGFDLLALEAIVHPSNKAGNKRNGANVSE